MTRPLITSRLHYINLPFRRLHGQRNGRAEPCKNLQDQADQDCRGNPTHVGAQRLKSLNLKPRQRHKQRATCDPPVRSNLRPALPHESAEIPSWRWSSKFAAAHPRTFSRTWRCRCGPALCPQAPVSVSPKQIPCSTRRSPPQIDLKNSMEGLFEHSDSACRAAAGR